MDSCVCDTVTAGGSRIPPAPGINPSPGHGLGAPAARAGAGGAVRAAGTPVLHSWTLPGDTGTGGVPDGNGRCS